MLKYRQKEIWTNSSSLWCFIHNKKYLTKSWQFGQCWGGTRYEGTRYCNFIIAVRSLGT